MRDLLETLVECFNDHSVLPLDCRYLLDQVVHEWVVQSQSVLTESVLPIRQVLVLLYDADLHRDDRLR